MVHYLGTFPFCSPGSHGSNMDRSTLSHDFYEVMVGRSDMTLYGWKQLIEWSLLHSCMSQDELGPVRAKWEQLWDKFLDWVIDAYGDVEAEEEKIGKCFQRD